MALLSLHLVLIATLAAGTTSEPCAGATAVVTRRVGLTGAEGLELAEKISAHLAAAGLAMQLEPKEVASRLAAAGISDGASCEGKKPCALDLGTILGVCAIVAVELGALSTSVAIHLEALWVAGGDRLAQQDITSSRARIRSADAMDLDAFAQQARAELSSRSSLPSVTPAASAKPDAPLQETRKTPPPSATLVPPPREAAAAPKSAPGSPRLVAALGVSGAALGAGAAALAFVVMGADSAGRIAPSSTLNGRPFVNLPRAQAEQFAANANRDYTIGAAAAAGCAALAAVATYLFVTHAAATRSP